jgi:hypothetical protein
VAAALRENVTLVGPRGLDGPAVGMGVNNVRLNGLARRG